MSEQAPQAYPEQLMPTQNLYDQPPFNTIVAGILDQFGPSIQDKINTTKAHKTLQSLFPKGSVAGDQPEPVDFIRRLISIITKKHMESSSQDQILTVSELPPDHPTNNKILLPLATSAALDKKRKPTAIIGTPLARKICNQIVLGLDQVNPQLAYLAEYLNYLYFINGAPKPHAIETNYPSKTYFTWLENQTKLHKGLQRLRITTPPSDLPGLQTTPHSPQGKSKARKEWNQLKAANLTE